MDFFGIGPLEVLFILLIALIAFGPGKMPEIARGIARAVRSLRKATMDLTTEVSREFKDLEVEELAKKQAPGKADRKKEEPVKVAEHEASSDV